MSLVSKIDFSKIKQPHVELEDMHPNMPEIIEYQATMNIGTVGHVSHGKTTLVKAISEINTVKFRQEMVRNITIKLGYANAKIYRCSNEKHVAPSNYESHSSSHPNTYLCRQCNQNQNQENKKSDNNDNVDNDNENKSKKHYFKLVKHVSFVDCPGHDYLMATMLSATTVMNAVILLIAANEECPQPTTAEHLAALEIMKIPNILIIQNKLDLIAENIAKQHYLSILRFIKGTIAQNSPQILNNSSNNDDNNGEEDKDFVASASSNHIIPCSAMEKLNIDAILHFIDTNFALMSKSESNYEKSPKFTIIRSFSATKSSGASISALKGGIAGGSLIQGILRLGDKIEIRPGIIERSSSGSGSGAKKLICRPLLSKIISLQAEKQLLRFAVPCGLIGIGTDLDPSLCLGDKLSGQTLGLQGEMPEIAVELTIKYFLLQNILGVRNVENFNQQGGMSTRVKMLQKNENVMLNIGSLSTGCTVRLVLSQQNSNSNNGNNGATSEDNFATITLKTPVCAEVNQNCSISRKYDTTWRLIGVAQIVKTVTIDPVYDDDLDESLIGFRSPAGLLYNKQQNRNVVANEQKTM